MMDFFAVLDVGGKGANIPSPRSAIVFSPNIALVGRETCQSEMAKEESEVCLFHDAGATAKKEQNGGFKWSL